jgi:P pilus assembly chaperone PapD
MKIPASSALLALVFAIVVPAQAALTWETTEVDLHPGLADKTAVAHFKYKNTGDKPVKITSVHSSCGCTTAALAKEVVVQPPEVIERMKKLLTN